MPLPPLFLVAPSGRKYLCLGGPWDGELMMVTPGLREVCCYDRRRQESKYQVDHTNHLLWHETVHRKDRDP